MSRSESLLTIQAVIQQVIEATTPIVGLQIMVIDENNLIVAATGTLRKSVGKVYFHEELTKEVMTLCKPIVVEDPHYHPSCERCKRKDECQNLAMLICPISLSNKARGLVVFSATNEKQKWQLLSRREKLLLFLEKFSLLLASVLSDSQRAQQLNMLASRLDIIINSVDAAIISTDETGLVTHCNKAACKLLDLPAEEVVGKPITTIFHGMPEIAVLFRKPWQGEVFHLTQQRKTYYWANVNPVLSSSIAVGLVMFFCSVNELRLVASFFDMQPFISFDEIIGAHPSILDVKEKLTKIALTDATVLLRGETGVGKDLFARATHFASRRKDKPFVAVNCASIPESLLESELFGYEEGAFTGARKGGKPGKFEIANGGTLFLDEIGDMPLHLQAKLLRVLEERVIEKLGGTRPVPVDVRVISATHRNLEEMVQRGQFREDLYYRLNVVPVTIPPLRERKSDIELLAMHFIEKLNAKLGKNILGILPDALEKLISYPWPGNVRELRNAIEYAMTLESDSYITLKSLPTEVIEYVDKSSASKPPGRLREIEEKAILDAIEQFGNTTAGKEKAAKFLGIGRTTLYRKLKRLQSSYVQRSRR